MLSRCGPPPPRGGAVMYFIGVDLGQKVDFTAIAVVERRAESKVLRVRHLERMGLGTPYTKVAERINALAWHPKLMRPRVVMDSTGVGAPVVDLLRASGCGGHLTEITITGGEKAKGSGERWSVPRKDLLGAVEVLIETGRLEIARKLKEAETLVKELQAMRFDGRGGEHDDLAFALALACWRARSVGDVGYRNQPLIDVGYAPEGYRFAEDLSGRGGEAIRSRRLGSGWRTGR